MKCKYCTRKATKKVIWADGRAFIPTCDSHVVYAKDRIKDQNDRVTKIVRI
jgi:hypothetical protein